MYQLFFQLQRKNIFFRDQKKKSENIFTQKYFPHFFGHRKKIKSHFLKKSHIFFSDIFLEKYFWAKIFSDFFLIPKKNIFSLELEKKLVHNFDVENS